MERQDKRAFETFTAGHPVGTRVRARVATAQPFGVFCELVDGVQGLLLVVDFAGGPRPMKYPADYPRVGDQIDVWIEMINVDEGKIKLTQRPAVGH